MSSLSDRQKEGRVLRLSGFFWGLAEAERTPLRRTMHKLLDVMTPLPTAWSSSERSTRRPVAARPAAAQRVADFYLERPDVANRPGAYGV